MNEWWRRRLFCLGCRLLKYRKWSRFPGPAAKKTFMYHLLIISLRAGGNWRWIRNNGGCRTLFKYAHILFYKIRLHMGFLQEFNNFPNISAPAFSAGYVQAYRFWSVTSWCQEHLTSKKHVGVTGKDESCAGYDNFGTKQGFWRIRWSFFFILVRFSSNHFFPCQYFSLGERLI